MRVALVLLLLVSPAFLAGCARPAVTPTGATLALPHIGDSATYVAHGAFLDFRRWANGFTLPPTGESITLAIGASGAAVDGTRRNWSAFEATLSDTSGTISREFVSPEHASLVQSWSPLNGEQAVLAFDERGYPWAWGASVLQGRPLTAGRVESFSLPANAREGASASDPQGVPLALSFRIGAVEPVPYETPPVDKTMFARPANGVRVELAENASVDWRLWFDPSIPYPLRIEAHWRNGGLAPYVRVDQADAPLLVFTADLVAFTRGATSTPPRDSTATFPTEQVGAALETWDGTAPPEGAPGYEPFALSEAIQWASLTDAPWKQWSAAHPDAHLYRATYSAAPGAVAGSVAHSWLVYYVSSANDYYAFEVNRTQPASAPTIPPPLDAAPIPAAGVTQTVMSGPADAPRGEHGWFAADRLPKKLLTLSSAVALVEGTFREPRVEIFLRSFTDPVGYGYYIDGGVGQASDAGKKPDRFTVIVSAESAFIEAAVGPVKPLVASPSSG
ncbi:MAG: hypothetical protein ACYDCK_00675 [Thermoplasmatota archaeon]